MVEETEDSGMTSARGGPDPSAMAFALGAAAQNASVAAEAQSYLKEQTRLARIQAARLEAEERIIDEQQLLELSHLRMRRFSDWSKMALEIAAGLFLLALVGGFGVMVWNAANDRALVVDAFSVPPDMAARGLTGSVVASELLDRLGQMEAQTEPTAQSEGTYRLDLADNVRIEIPETGGLSLGEIDRYLREKLGNETHVRGEIVRTQAGLTMFVRASAEPGLRADGSENDLAGLIAKSAENLFAQSEPLRYCDYLTDNAHFDDAIRRLRPMTLAGTAFHRAEALTNWAEALDFSGHAREARNVAVEAVHLIPYASFAWAVISDADNELGWEEDAQHSEFEMVRTAHQAWSADDLRTISIGNYPKFMLARATSHRGDMQASAQAWALFYAAGANGIPEADTHAALIEYAPALAKAHELDLARQLMQTASGYSDASNAVGDSMKVRASYAQAIFDFYASDWAGVIGKSRQLDAAELAGQVSPYISVWRKVNVWPLAAIALIRLGDIPGAEQIVAKTGTDCDPCVRARGWIAVAKGDWPAAAYWFGTVAARSPSVPFADTDWGEALMRKGDLDSAIAKFRLANAISPHFADPLEMWGEALTAKNRSDLALAKFAEADKYAPNWGRLHLKWGEALLWAGKRDDAQKQFALAAGLDLSAVDQSQLARMRNSHG